ncbi:unnamed protein product, partial [Rotaria sp. Silwood1]
MDEIEFDLCSYPLICSSDAMVAIDGC